ncbi:MAG: penicillin-binding protein 2, partial [Lactobacillaceae bacterium]|nr:penicillin-binding protein 2 [Lactobacillaceae bacterium]
MKNYSDLEKNTNSKIPTNNEILSLRLNVLFGIIVFLLSLLVLKLALITIVSGNEYKQLVNKTEVIYEKQAVPRGLIYDSAGQVVTNNTPIASVMFNRSGNESAQSILKIADKLSKYLSVNSDNLTQRQEIDYYLANPNNINEVINKLGYTQNKLNQLTSAEVNKKMVDYLTKSNFSLPKKQKTNAFIYDRMIQTPNESSGVIKEKNVSDQEIASIGERQSSLKGISVTQNWSRTQSDDESMRQILGSLSTSTTGIPDSQLKKMQAFGYALNSRVGISGLEQQYELQLRGIDKVNEVSSDGSLDIQKIVNKGMNGENLHLTINSEFQKIISQATKKNILGGGSTGGYAMVINPYTGGIYAMTGWDRDNKTHEISSNPLATIFSPFAMGSAVKPAMVANALQKNIITPSENTLVDQAIKIAGTPEKTSFFNKEGTPYPLTAQEALAVSSNTYMIQLALKMNGTPYSPGMSLNISDNIWNELRNGFEQFGLGYKTGIDLPGETSGYKAPSTGDNAGKFVDLSFGQVDQYTVVQMARYISAIANGGKLITPHVVSSINVKNNQIDKQVYSASNVASAKINLTADQWN